MQTGGVHAETVKNHDFLSGALFAGADRRRGRRDWKKPFLPGALFAGADRWRGRRDWKKPWLYIRALFIRCKQAAWTQRPEKTITFYRELYLSGADRRRGRRDRRKPKFFIWGFICRCRQARDRKKPWLFIQGFICRGRRDQKKPWLFIRGFIYQVQTGGVDAETGKNHNFLSGALCICRGRQAAWTQRPENLTFYGALFASADKRRGRRGRKNLDFLSGALCICRCRQAVWTQTGKHDFLSGALFCRCRQSAWTQWPKKNMTFYPGLNFAGAERRRGLRDRKKPWLFIRGFMYLQVQTGGVDADRKKHDFLFGALFCRCRQSAWTQWLEKTWLFIRDFILQVQTGGVDSETGKNHDFLSGA